MKHLIFLVKAKIRILKCLFFIYNEIRIVVVFSTFYASHILIVIIEGNLIR